MQKPAISVEKLDKHFDDIHAVDHVREPSPEDAPAVAESAIELVREPVRERVLALTRLRLVIVMWRSEVEKTLERQVEDRVQMLVMGANQLDAYDPATGRELWRMRGLESNAVTTPLAGDGVVVFSSGYPSKISVAVRPGGEGVAPDRILWENRSRNTAENARLSLRSGP